MKRAWIILAVLAAVLVGGFVLYGSNALKVETASLERGLAVEAVYATGIVEPENWARIGPPSTGRIAEIAVREGDHVEIGAVLVRLDDREARSRVTELEAKAVYWREELQRAKTLADRGIRARESEEKARSEFDQAAAAINAAKRRLADLTIVSPLAGTVLRRDGEIGEVVGPDSALVWVGEKRPLRITADVDEEDIAQVRPGQKVLIKADSFPNSDLSGTIDRITPKGDPINKTFRVRVRLPDDSPLMVGMTAEINVITKEKPDAALIPAAALTGAGIFTIIDGKAQLQKPAIGIRGRDRIEVLNGLDATAKIIVNPPAGLKSGDRVRIQ